MTGHIVYHCLAAHAYTLAGWRRVIAREDGMPGLTLETYEQMRDDLSPTPGTHVFTDVDRLDVDGMRKAVALARRIVAAGPGYAVANWPNFVLGRYELLRRLQADGRNHFRCLRMEERPATLRYPVFLRRDRAHDGAETPLLYDARALAAAIRAQLIDHGWRREDILIVEYLDTDRFEGSFAKYSAYCAFEEVYPANMVISADWMAKSRRVHSESAYAAEVGYLRGNPHAEEIAAIFRLANIDYGRIDYGLKGGRLQVFEINTNPDLLAENHWTDPVRRERMLVPFQIPSTRAIFRRIAAACVPGAAPAAAASARALARFHDMVAATRAAAERGEPEGQFKLATMYGTGQWLPRDAVQAWKWFELAAVRLAASGGDGHARAVAGRDHIAQDMSEEQIAAARRLAEAWKAAG